MKQQNNTHDSTEEHWKVAQYIRSDGAVEIYSNYMVSDHGRVGSLTDTRGNKLLIMKILKPRPCDKLGHLQVNLRANNKRHYRSVHRIVLSSFHPELYFSGAEVDHFDRDPANNYLVNLHWTDHNGNCTNRALNPLKKIRVTRLNDGHTEEFDNMMDCSRAFRKRPCWCEAIIRKFNGFNAKHNILIEKI